LKKSLEKNNKRACILTYPVDLLSMDQALDKAEEYIINSQGAHVVTINPEMITQARNNPTLDEILKSAELVIPDGIGVIIGLKTFGVKTPQLPGIEFSEQLIAICAQKGYKVGFLGAQEETLNLAVQNLEQKYPGLKVVFKRNGYFSDEDESQFIEDIKNAQPDVLFVALGVPKQEFWIYKYKNLLSHTIMVGVGGSFDVWANKVQRAPLAFRKLGLEWFYRLITQPSRFRRMFPTLPLFLLKVIFKRNENRKEY